MKEIRVAGILLLWAAQAAAGGFEALVRQTSESAAEASRQTKEAIDAAKKASSLRCVAAYSVDAAGEEKLVGTHFWLVPAGDELDSGVSFTPHPLSFIPSFSVDLGQFDRLEKNKSGNSGRVLNLKGKESRATKIRPYVDVLVKPYYRSAAESGEFEGFILTIIQVEKKLENIPYEQRRHLPYFYARSYPVKAVKGARFNMDLWTWLEGVGAVELACQLD